MIKNFFKKILTFMKDMGIVITFVVTLIPFLYLYEPFQKQIASNFLFICLGGLLLSFSFALIKKIYLFFKNDIKIKIKNPSIEVEIKFGDLFAQETNIIVGFSNYFDTALGNVIAIDSIQGQFEEKYYKNNTVELDKNILSLLRKKRDYAITNNDKKKYGKKQEYKIGTTITLEKNNKKYFLCAYSEMNNECKASSSFKYLETSLNELWTEIRNYGQCKPISIPLIGTGLSRLQCNKLLLLFFIILHFISSSREQIISKKLTIVLNKKEKNNYNLSDIKNALDTMLKE